MDTRRGAGGRREKQRAAEKLKGKVLVPLHAKRTRPRQEEADAKAAACRVMPEAQLAPPGVARLICTAVRR